MADWSEAQKEQLRILWAEGLSASIIAERIGGFSRNAVIAKVHRSGFPGRKTTKKAGQVYKFQPRIVSSSGNIGRFPCPPDPAIERKRANAREETRHVMEQMDRCEKPPLKVPLLELKDHSCRWPVGDPHDENFGFCGHRKQFGSSYCPFHFDMAIKPIPSSRRGLPMSEDEAA